MGPTVTINSQTQGQYLQFAGNLCAGLRQSDGESYVQQRSQQGAGGTPILGTLFTPNAVKPCKSPINEGIAEYDRLDSAFVLGDIAFNPAAGNYHYCFGISANNTNNGAVSTSLQGPGNGKSYWNVYVYNISPALPFKANGKRFYPAHPRFGSWSDGLCELGPS